MEMISRLLSGYFVVKIGLKMKLRFYAIILVNMFCYNSQHKTQ